MALRAVEQLYTGTTTPISSYDSTKINLGTLMIQKTGALPADKFVGPMPVAIARPLEESTGVAMMFPHAITWSTTYDWVFTLENTVAGTTRRIFLYEYNKTTALYNWKGFITATLNTAATHTNRGFRVQRSTHIEGTIAVTGTAVTGTTTTWVTDRLAAGARIGFGSTDPTAIATWYQISAVGSNTGITLAISAPTLGAGTSYVIEELRFVITTTNSTLTNGGIFVVKGINYNDFISTGTTISASAGATDNLKLVYWLADAGTVTNTVAGGAALQTTSVTNTSHNLHVINGTVSIIVYKYNLRANDTIVGGKMTLTGANIIITGTQAVTGTASQVNNGRVDILSHGPGSAVESLYFVTTTRIYRAAIANITAANTTWQSENRTEVPTGNTNTFPATGALNSLEVASNIDRLIVITTGLTAFRHYVTQYPTTSGDPFQHIWGIDDKQQDQSTADANSSIHFNGSSQSISTWSENGIVHIIKHGATAALCQMYALPFGAHWSYASTTNQRVISPSISTPNCVSFGRILTASDNIIGGTELRVPIEPYRVYYRTSGITDNSGAWIAVDDSGDLSGATGATAIQFMYEFATIGWTCLPARIVSTTVTYQDNTTDSHYQPSVAQSSIASKIFAWRFSTAFGSTVPSLRVRLYDAVTAGLLLDDTTVLSASGVWEKSTDGTTWGAYNTTDKGNETTYIRYTPTSLGNNIKVRALLTQ